MPEVLGSFASRRESRRLGLRLMCFKVRFAPLGHEVAYYIRTIALLGYGVRPQRIAAE